MTRNDRTALKLAMEIAQRDPLRAKQLQAKLEDESWDEVAQFASYCCQNRALNLLPWQEPPCWGDTERCDPDAKKLLQKMLAAGVSRFTRSADGIATGQPTQAI
jgi:hypothetical protein